MLHYPVFRLGFVIASGRAIRMETAERIGNAILDGAHEFRRAILDCIEANPEATAPADQEDKGPKVRRTPAIVIDFWPIQAMLGGHKVEIRSCVTICVNHKQSKCWTRINMIDEQVEEEKADALFDTFETLARAVNEAIFELYRKFIRKVLRRKLEMSKYYELNVRTASRADDWIEDYFQTVFSDREGGRDIGKLKKHLDSLLLSMNSDIGEIPPAKRVIERKGKKKRQIGLTGIRTPHRNDAPFSLHRVNVIYVIEYGSASANFTGVGYDPYINSGIQHRESLSHIASANLAVEYGGLF